MGYLPNKRLIRENEDLLDALLTSMQRGETYTITVEPEQLGLTHYQLNRLLASTETFKSECGGRFSGLRKLIRFRIDHEGSKIIATPTGIRYAEVRRTLDEALADLSASKATTELIEFYPSEAFTTNMEASISALKDRVEAMGWDLVPSPITGEDGSLAFGALKAEAEETRGFDVLTQHTREQTP